MIAIIISSYCIGAIITCCILAVDDTKEQLKSQAEKINKIKDAIKDTKARPQLYVERAYIRDITNEEYYSAKILSIIEQHEKDIVSILDEDITYINFNNSVIWTIIFWPIIAVAFICYGIGYSLYFVAKYISLYPRKLFNFSMKLLTKKLIQRHKAKYILPKEDFIPPAKQAGQSGYRDTEIIYLSRAEEAKAMQEEKYRQSLQAGRVPVVSWSHK